MTDGVPDVPLFVVVATVWAYTACVACMAVRARLGNRAPGLLVPTERFERRLWCLWVPVVIAQNALPALAIQRRHFLLAVPEFSLTNPTFSNLRWAASVCALLCLLVTMTCWARMGTSWRVGVAPNQRTALVTGGLYAHIRHPIYALNALLFACVAIVLPTVPMITVAVLHTAFLMLKARHEERFLAETHGSDYTEYCRRTGRFFPRFTSREKSSRNPDDHLGKHPGGNSRSEGGCP